MTCASSALGYETLLVRILRCDNLRRYEAYSKFRNSVVNQFTSPFDVCNRNFIVTGANGYLGRTFSKGLLEAGANVLAISRNRGLLDDAVQGRFKENLQIELLDCNDESLVGQAISVFQKRFGDIDGLVNNAYSAPRRPSFDMTTTDIQKVIQDCFIQYWTTIRALIPFANKDHCSIVNNSSLWASLAPNLDMYLDLRNEPSIALTVSKAAVNQLTRYTSILFAKDGIRVNSLVPGAFPQKRSEIRLDYVDQIEQRIPMRRIGRPEELIGPVIFLLSRASSYMTGQTLNIDGGYTIY